MSIDAQPSTRRRAARVAAWVSAFATLSSGCVSEEDASTGAGPGFAEEAEGAGEDLEQASQALYGAPTVEGENLPEGTAQLVTAVQRAAKVAVSSEGFAWCVDHAM